MLSCKSSWRSVKPLLRYGDFFDVSKRRPSAVLDLLCSCLNLHDEQAYLGVLITLQILVRIDTVVSIIRKCSYLTSLA